MLFTTSPASGCGGLINLTSIQSKSFRTQQEATYQPFEECHWTVVTSPAKSISFTINSIDIKNSINNITQRDKCSGDYLEVNICVYVWYVLLEILIIRLHCTLMFVYFFPVTSYM